MEYDYEAVDRRGEPIEGRLEAESPAAVVRQLSSDGHTVVAVRERRPVTALRFARPLRNAEVVIALQELATLLGSGVALGDAVQAQSGGSHHPAVSAAFAAVAKDLLRGESFLTAMRGSGLPLPEYVYQLLEAGELGGRLPQALGEAVAQLKDDQRVAADLRSALVYPAVLVVSGIAAVLLIFIFVVPKFAHLLGTTGRELPLLATVVLGTGVWFNDNVVLALLAATALALVAAALWRNRGLRARLLDVVARLPVLGQWLAETDTAKWASVMGAMLAARVELMDALTLAGRGVRVAGRRAMLGRAVAEVRQGSALSAALEKQRALTPTGYNLIRVGEQSGDLAPMMRALAGLYEENSARRMKRVLALVEPLAILLIGAAVGLIMAGIIQAITSANELAI